MPKPVRSLQPPPSLPSPTEEQSFILGLLSTTSANILIDSVAGSGKTTMLEMLQADRREPTLCLAFNTRIADRMRETFSSLTTVKTLNSLGHGIWAKACSGTIVVNARKVSDLLREKIKSLPKNIQGEAYEQFSEIVSAIGLAKAIGYVPERYFPNARRLATLYSVLASTDESLSDLSIDLLDEVLVASIRSAYAGLVDFNDQVYMPALFGGTYPRHPLVLIDEAQDLSPVNHEMLFHLRHSRLIAVGDPWQCHPPGTLIRITGSKGGYIPIESLREGMQVAHYDTKDALFKGLTVQGKDIQHIEQSEFDGDLVVVSINQKLVKMTPNHRVITRINRESFGCLLYLMKRDNRFRLGTSKIFHNGNAFGPSMRARQERADAIWILAHYPSEEEAYIKEQVLSIKHGVPTILFESEKQQDRIDAIWAEMPDTRIGARELLHAFHRDESYPIWRDEYDNFIGFHRACIIEACNLMPELMTMLTFPAGTWSPIQVEYEPYTGPVYGLTVEEAQDGKRLYLANDFLVHNSIYGFRGAVQSGMEKLRTRFEMIPAPLSVSFRCPRAIVEAARWRVPHMKWSKPGGRVAHLKNPSATAFADGSAIICRNNAPLFALALRLLRAGRSVSVGGSDIGPRIVGIMKRLGEDSTTQKELLNAIEGWREAKLEKESKTANDIADCMRVFAEHGNTLSQSIAYAEHLFAQKGTITLLTGHKAKGLEWGIVYHLDEWLIGNHEQDLNLRYVIQTRALETYYEIESREIRW